MQISIISEQQAHQAFKMFRQYLQYLGSVFLKSLSTLNQMRDVFKHPASPELFSNGLGNFTTLAAC
jgi:hypothetical protein